MKCFLTILSFILAVHLSGQLITPESIGFKHLQTIFKKENIDILIKSKKGEELTPKPLFLFIQGSLPRPLIIIYDSTHTYPVFPFKLDSL